MGKKRSLIYYKMLMILALLTPFYTAIAHGNGDPADERAIWEWSPEEIKKEVTRVRAGKDLTPESWPDNGRVAVSLSFDVDTEPVWMGFQEQSSPSYMSRGEYGARAGMPRVMKLLKKHDIPATFFIPAMSMELHPEIIPMIQENPRNEFGKRGRFIFKL
jgi:hypothetical protein